MVMLNSKLPSVQETYVLAITEIKQLSIRTKPFSYYLPCSMSQLMIVSDANSGLASELLLYIYIRYYV